MRGDQAAAAASGNMRVRAALDPDEGGSEEEGKQREGDSGQRLAAALPCAPRQFGRLHLLLLSLLLLSVALHVVRPARPPCQRIAAAADELGNASASDAVAVRLDGDDPAHGSAARLLEPSRGEVQTVQMASRVFSALLADVRRLRALFERTDAEIAAQLHRSELAAVLLERAGRQEAEWGADGAQRHSSAFERDDARTRHRCRVLPVFIEPSSSVRRASRQQGTANRRPAVSLVFVVSAATQSGARDDADLVQDATRQLHTLMNSLAAQTLRGAGAYELVVVDELAFRTASYAWRLADVLGVELVYYGPPKAVAPVSADAAAAGVASRGGLCSALNTGILMARGDVVVTLRGAVHLQPNFLQALTASSSSSAVGAEQPRRVFAFSIEYFTSDDPEAALRALRETRRAPSALSSTSDVFTAAGARPRAAEWRDGAALERMRRTLRSWTDDAPASDANNASPKFLSRHLHEEAAAAGALAPHARLNISDQLFDLSAAAFPRAALEQLNGLDESLEAQDDGEMLCTGTSVHTALEHLGWEALLHGETAVEQWTVPGGAAERAPPRRNDGSAWRTVRRIASLGADGGSAAAAASWNLTQWWQDDCPLHMVAG